MIGKEITYSLMYWFISWYMITFYDQLVLALRRVYAFVGCSHWLETNAVPINHQLYALANTSLRLNQWIFTLHWQGFRQPFATTLTQEYSPILTISMTVTIIIISSQLFELTALSAPNTSNKPFRSQTYSTLLYNTLNKYYIQIHRCLLCSALLFS